LLIVYLSLPRIKLHLTVTADTRSEATIAGGIKGTTGPSDATTDIDK
jgi:hypothetical protein